MCLIFMWTTFTVNITDFSSIYNIKVVACQLQELHDWLSEPRLFI